MAIRGVSITAVYWAWNTSTNAPQTGDAGNHTIKLIKDGVEATATNAPAEVDSTNDKGKYTVVLTLTEMTCDTIDVGGISSTASVVLFGPFITTEHGVLPKIQQGSAGCLPTVGTGTYQIQTDGAGNAYANVNTWATQVVGVDANNRPIVSAWYDGLGNFWTAGVVGTGSASAGSNGAHPSITLASTTNVEVGQLVRLYQGAGVGQTRVIISVLGGNVCWVDRAWSLVPDNTSGYQVLSDDRARCSVGAVGDSNVTYTLGTGLLSTPGYVGVDWAHVNNPSSAVNLSGTTVNLCNTLTTYTGNTLQTGDSFIRLGAPAGASVSADIAALKSETDTILTDVNTGAGAIYTRLGAPAGASIAADLAEIEAETDAMGGSAPSVAQIVTGIFQELTSSSNFTLTGSIGAYWLTQLGKLNGSVISIVAGVGLNGTIAIAQNSDCKFADGAAIRLRPASANFWIDLTGATVTLCVDGMRLCSGTVPTPTGSQEVRFEPTAAQTARLTPAVHYYAAWAVLSGGDNYYLGGGLLNVASAQGGP